MKTKILPFFPLRSHPMNARPAGAGAGPSPFPTLERVVLPGDDVTEVIEAALLGAADASSTSSAAAATIRLGAGLAQAPDTQRIVCTKAGVLAHRAPDRFFVLASQQRYAPSVGDTVVGVVLDKSVDAYKVRLHGTGLAQLPALAFDGASKRNKPSLAVGATVFARVAACSKHMEPELSCQGA
jgi:exosome complex component RRP40